MASSFIPVNTVSVEGGDTVPVIYGMRDEDATGVFYDFSHEARLRVTNVNATVLFPYVDTEEGLELTGTFDAEGRFRPTSG